MICVIIKMMTVLAFPAMEIDNLMVANANAQMEPMTMEKIILVLNAIILGLFIKSIIALVLEKLGTTVVLESGLFNA